MRLLAGKKNTPKPRALHQTRWEEVRSKRRTETLCQEPPGALVGSLAERPCHGSLSCPQRGWSRHTGCPGETRRRPWPEGGRRGRDGTRRELILTENTRSAEAASSRQVLGDAAPLQPGHLQAHLSPRSLLMRAEGAGLRTNSGRRVAGRPVCESTGAGSRNGCASPGPDGFRGLSAFLSNSFLPGAPEAGRRGRPTTDGMGF